MRPQLRWLFAAATAAAALQAATQAFAWVYGFDSVLGAAWRPTPALALYPPAAVLGWLVEHPKAGPGRSAAGAAALATVGGAVVAGRVVAALSRPRRRRGWGGLADARRAGLLEDAGCILGELEGRLLATMDLRPTLVTGGTRAGKGRGHVVPTLLSWTDSVLVHDPKGELWRATAGWRGRFSHACFLNPRSPHSVRFNPLAEIRPGPAEVGQVQRLVAVLSDPAGGREEEPIWDRAAGEILAAVILHVLYSEPVERKALIVVRDLLADLDETVELMGRTLHRLGPDGEPQVHPFIATACKGFAAMHARFRTSVQGTARSYLAWLAGEDLERALSASDFALGDLMCADHPVSLYVQTSPADAVALRPYVRLLFYAAAQSLTLDERADAAGRPKRRPLLMLMDEFPLLGRLAFFEKSLRLMSGYGIKAMFVAQSLNDVVETYGPHNTILDNCHVYTAFSALDPLTQEKVSKLTGTVLEPRVSRSAPAGLAGGRASVSRSLVERPLLEPGEIRALPDDVQLTFAAGQRPLRTRKLRYDRHAVFRRRAHLAPPDQAVGVDTPGAPPHPWADRRALGLLPAPEPEAELSGLSSSPPADLYDRLAADFAAQEAARERSSARGS